MQYAMVIMAALAVIDVIAISAATSIICFIWYNGSNSFMVTIYLMVLITAVIIAAMLIMSVMAITCVLTVIAATFKISFYLP